MAESRGKHGAAPSAPKKGGDDKSKGDGGNTPRKKSSLKIVFIVLVAAAIVLAAIAGFGYFQQLQASSKSTDPIVPSQSSQDNTVQLANNPIDFAMLTKEYPDTIGWISVPDTKVNYQIVRSTTDDSFYLNHDVDGNVNIAGAVYMELINNPQFLDYVTVLYGHCLDTDAMFSTLHYFEDKNFFDSHSTFYIYAPGHIYTYTIVSAFNYDDRHIINSFNFSNADVRLSYYQMLQNPESLVVNKRSDVQMTADSKIVQLSTCLSGYSNDNQRYIVTGVLTNDQPTY